MPRRSSSKEPISVWLGQDMRLEGGLLRFEGTLRVDGEVIAGHLIGPTLIIGEDGRVSGHIEVGSLTVFGKVDAEAKVKNTALIAPGGIFEGEMILERPVLSVEEGGTFQGKIRMAEPAT